MDLKKMDTGFFQHFALKIGLWKILKITQSTPFIENFKTLNFLIFRWYFQE
jgi:hypothetical protein